MFKDGMNCITRRKNARKRKGRTERENKTIEQQLINFITSLSTFTNMHKNLYCTSILTLSLTKKKTENLIKD